MSNLYLINEWSEADKKLQDVFKKGLDFKNEKLEDIQKKYRSVYDFVPEEIMNDIVKKWKERWEKGLPIIEKIQDDAKDKISEVEEVDDEEEEEKKEAEIIDPKDKRTRFSDGTLPRGVINNNKNLKIVEETKEEEQESDLDISKLSLSESYCEITTAKE